MKRLKQLTALILTVCLLCGCSIADYTVFFSNGCGPNTAFAIGKNKCDNKEVQIYITSFADYYGEIGDVFIWDKNLRVETADIEQSIVNGVKQLLPLVYALNIYAEEKEITLSEDQLAQVSEAASLYFNGLSEDKKKELGLTLEDVIPVAQRYAIALMVYDHLVKEIDQDVSEDEARVADAYVLEIEDEEILENVAGRCGSKTSFPVLVQNFSCGKTGIQHIPRGEYPKEVEDVLTRMEDDEISEAIACGGKTYYIYCIDKYNEEYSEYNKQKIIYERQQELLAQIEAAQNENYYSEINEEYWNNLQVEGNNAKKDQLFFTIIEKTFVID